MSVKKVRGIVIEAKPKGENDKWLTLLCKDVGKISVKARGSRRPNSKLFACTALFSYCDFIINDRLSFYSMDSGDIIRSFLVGCDDIETISAANYFLEITNRILKHGLEDNEFMYLLLKALQALDKHKNNVRLIGTVFEIRSLAVSGFMPYLDGCMRCGNGVPIYFHPEGVLCQNCTKGTDCVKLTAASYEALRDIILCPAEALFGLTYDEETANILSRCAKLMIKYYLNTDFRTYDMLKSLGW